MSTTLKDRIQECLAERKMTNAALARAADVAKPTAYLWGNGKTKNIKGGPLLRAASALGVTPGWLATGKGPKYPADIPSALMTGEQPAFYGAATTAHGGLAGSLRLLGDCLTTASEEARKKALPLLHALLLNPDQAVELAPIIAKSLGRAEAPAQERAFASR